MDQPLSVRLGAEALGTFLFFFLGFSGIAVAVSFGFEAIGPLGIAAGFGFGLTLAITAFGQLSGGHFNPAVSAGLAVAGRFPGRDVVPYWIAQLVGGFGAVLRSLHFWLSGIFIVTLTLHLLRTFATAAYKAPREGIWLTGVALFTLGGGLLFTGTILKWDQEAFEAFGHNIEIAELLGVFGFLFSPEFTDSVSLLTRTYVAHVSILPLLLAGLVGVHVLLVKRLRISPAPFGTPEEAERREREEPRLPFTTHLARLLYWTLVALGIALVLAALRPTGIGPEGVEGIEITKPPWYFLWLYPLENWFGLRALVVMPALLLAGLAALPFVDRSRERDPRRRRAWMAFGSAVLVLWIFLTIYGFNTIPVSHVGEM